MVLPVIQPSRVTVMIKPVGALCNLDCTYCYYLPTKTIYDHREHRMSIATLEAIFASVLPRFGQEVTIAWQGGEPTLAGLDFFKQAIAFQKQYARPGQRINHALQTNGTLLDDDWCNFLREQEFLIGLSMDGPPRFHDHYRLTNRGSHSSDAVLGGLKLLQKHAVQYNILCVLNDVNIHHPDEVIGYLLNLGSRWLQFIPAIEWEPDPDQPGRNRLAPYSPKAADYGRFLCRTFDLWFERYRKRISIREIDAVLNTMVLGLMPFCILDGACHNQLTIEHDGAVFGCDHFVERRWQLGKIGELDWANPLTLDGAMGVGLTIHGQGYGMSDAGKDIHAIADVPGAEQGGETLTEQADPPALVSVVQSQERGSFNPDQNVEPGSSGPGLSGNGASESSADGRVALDTAWYDRLEVPRLGNFAARKQALPPGCLACEYQTLCYGGCPKHREHGGDTPEPTVLCEGYKMYYRHALPRMEWLAGFLRRGEQPPDPPGSAPAPGPAPGSTPGSLPHKPESPPAAPGPAPAKPAVAGSSPQAPSASRIAGSPPRRAPNPGQRAPGRNDPCPCGSGVKYKKCHGKNL